MRSSKYGMEPRWEEKQGSYEMGACSLCISYSSPPRLYKGSSVKVEGQDTFSLSFLA